VCSKPTRRLEHLLSLKTMRFQTLRREQWVPRPIGEVFAFFSDAHNLAEITPPWMSFRILSPAGIQIHAGTELRYRLRIHGLPVSWTTEIRVWDPPYRFTDTQRKGPYQLWHHTHVFTPDRGGTKMTDVVRYRLPLGAMGRLVSRFFVSRDVEKIFDYRRQRIEQLFGGRAGQAPA
jgi:uncharacterized protein